MSVLRLLLRCVPHRRAVAGLVVLATVAGCGGGSEFVASNPPPPPPVIVPVVGTITLLAGPVGGVGSNDGTPGRFNRPAGLATDTNGNTYKLLF